MAGQLSLSQISSSLILALVFDLLGTAVFVNNRQQTSLNNPLMNIDSSVYRPVAYYSTLVMCVV